MPESTWRRYHVLFVSILVAAFSACGGTGSSNNSNAAAPAASNPPTSSSPGSSGGSSGSSGSGSSSGSSGSGSSGSTGSGGSSGASGASGATEFSAILVRNSATQAGIITIDASQADGKGTVQVSGGDANFNYQLQFCSFRTGDCIVMGNVNTDASGNATTNFQFPQKGIFAGPFSVSAPGDTMSFESTFPAPPQTGQYESPLQRAGSVVDIAKMKLGTPGSDPLQSGQLIVTPNQANTPGSQTSLKFTLTGAAPNQSYLAGYCAGPDSSCYAITGPITTDASGNASATVSFTSYNNPGVFYLSRDGDPTGTLEFIVGFQVQ